MCQGDGVPIPALVGCGDGGVRLVAPSAHFGPRLRDYDVTAFLQDWLGSDQSATQRPAGTALIPRVAPRLLAWLRVKIHWCGHHAVLGWEAGTFVRMQVER